MNETDYKLRVERIKTLLQKCLGIIASLDKAKSKDYQLSNLHGYLEETKELTQEIMDVEFQKTKDLITKKVISEFEDMGL
jgi:hypothetical protein